MFVRYHIQENKVIRITVSEGTSKPYYLRAKGLKPSGVFVRQGTSSVSASPEKIRQMIKESDGDTFETMRSLHQNLTFNVAAVAFQKYGSDFGAEKYLALGMVQPGGTLFTNLALLLSDQCQHTTKIAVFGDDANTMFKDSKEFSGSIFKQLEDAFDYLSLCNKTSAIFKGLERIEHPDYPEAAIREALLNALVHRDYSFSGSIIINVNDSEMEFVSIGGLVPNLSPDDIRSGISQPRNHNLAEVFHRLRLIESYGTGIRKIFHLYENCSEKPRIEVTSNTFKMVLPNQNAAGMSTVQTSIERVSTITETQMAKVMEHIRKDGQITDEGIQKLLGLKKTRAFTLAKQMCDNGLITAIGRGKGKCYVAKE